MRGAARIVVWNDGQLFGQPELRALFLVHGVRRSRLPEWDDVLAQRCVQRIGHVHRQRNAKLRALRVLRRDRTVPDQLHGEFRLRFRPYVQYVRRGV